MRYIPHTSKDIEKMLEVIGVKSVEELFHCIPEEFRLKRELDIPPPMDETAIIKMLEEFSAATAVGQRYLSFQGAGLYPHYIPAAIDQILLRQEFYTSYTLYQPEISQGTLQAIYEFQTFVANLFGSDVANASVYDGASALAEAALMARRLARGKKNRILLSADIHPEYRQTVKTYLSGSDDEIVEISIGADGYPPDNAILAALDESAYALLLQYPNFFGQARNIEPLIKKAQERGTLVVVAISEPLSLALIKSPGAMGADIIVGEGQSFGIPLAFGGPSLGLFACKSEYTRQLPGRLVGETTDAEGNRGFVLTLATREQHIRRDKATSNICTNVGLNALAATIYLSLFGKEGLRKLAEQNNARMQYFLKEIKNVPGIRPRFNGNYFNEVPVACPVPAQKLFDSIISRKKIIPGVPLGKFYPELEDTLLVCLTEVHSKEEIDNLIKALKV